VTEMAFSMLKRIKPINPIGRIMGVAKDRSKNMATTPEKFSKQIHKLNLKGGTNADFMKIADTLTDDQLNYLIEKTEEKSQAERSLKPYGMDSETAYDSAIKWNLKYVKQGREMGERKEKNPRK
jgi:hypothetical protein